MIAAVIAPIIAAARDSCACGSAKNGAENRAFCARAITGHLAAKYAACNRADEAAHKLIVSIAAMLVAVVISIIMRRRCDRDRNYGDGR